MRGVRAIASRIVRKLNAGLSAINIFLGVTEGRWLRTRDLQAENAYQLHTIRLLQAEVIAKRAENADYLRQIKARATQSPSVQATDPAATPVQSGGDHSPSPRSLSASLAEHVEGSLVNLGEKHPELDGVVCLEQESRSFATACPEDFQSRIAAYAGAFQGRSYIQTLYEAELGKGGIVPRGIAVDFHPTSNTTVVPLLSNFPDLSVIVAGTAPFELAALLRNVTKHGLARRCVAIATDADHEWFRGSFADIVFGGTILHKLVHPKRLLKRAIEVLKPGGRAIFFGPFENGHAILRLAYKDILRDAEARQSRGPGFAFLNSLVADIEARSQRQNHPGLSARWRDLEDKWLFCKSDLETYCLECGAAAAYVRPFNHPTSPFTTQTRSSLEHYAGLTASDALPEWAWDTLRRYDDEAFSRDLLHDLVIEGTIVITK